MLSEFLLFVFTYSYHLHTYTFQIILEAYSHDKRKIHTSRKGKNSTRVTKHKHQHRRTVQKTQFVTQTFYQWRNRFVEGGKASLNGTPNGDVCNNLQKENDSLKKLIGDITISNDILKKTLENQKR